MNRRDFLVKSLVVAGGATLVPLRGRKASAALPAKNAGIVTGISFAAHPFDLADVRLLDGPFKQSMERDKAYLLSLEPDRFLHNFRVVAGLAPKAPIYGGWEQQPHGAGRCLGHYLSALSLHYRASGETQFQDRLDYLVEELALCQEKNGGGYLAGMIPAKAEFAAVAAGDGNGLQGQHPWYMQHKLFAGLRDAYALAGSVKARTVLIGLSDWAIGTTQALSDDQFQIMLKQEFGGMREVMADVYALTGDQKYLALADRFYHRAVEGPLADRQDHLNGLHANTQIPKIIGEARVYELTGALKSRMIAEYFWDTVVHHHSYVIGGNSHDEHFFLPDKIASYLTPTTAETCNTYNMLKLTRHLFTWNPRGDYADYYERALYNHILASHGPQPGQFTYFVSLKPGHFKTYSTPTESFWCCVGTGMENHVKYGDSIYFHGAGSLYVNLFIPSVLTWKEKGLTVTQETRYPEEGAVQLRLTCAKPVQLIVHVRCPGWSSPGFRIQVNGENLVTDASPGTFAAVSRVWKNGDVVSVRIPLSLRLETAPDDPAKVALLYGPIVLAGQLGSEGLAPPIPIAGGDQNAYIHVPDPPVPALAAAGGKPLHAWLKPVTGQPLTFQTVGAGPEVTLVPFYRLGSERYTIYWDMAVT